MLDIDLSWRMHKVSDGQRRRVQICMGLLRPYKVFHHLFCVISCRGVPLDFVSNGYYFIYFFLFGFQYRFFFWMK